MFIKKKIEKRSIDNSTNSIVSMNMSEILLMKLTKRQQ